MADTQTIEGEDVSVLELNGITHDITDRTLESRLSDEILDRQSADSALEESIGTVSSGLSDEVTARRNADSGLQDSINGLSSDLSGETTARQNADTALGNRVTTLENGLSGETTARQNADTGLGNRLTTVEGDLSSEVTARQNADTGLGNRITAIEDVIPSSASAQNQLADKDFVDSSVATNTANFLGTYTSMAQIEAIQNPTNNDYVFLQTTDQQGNSVFDRYKYNATQQEWLFEYELNNSSFTASQWATINSGLTQNSVDSSISDALADLDVASSGGNGKYIKSISETDGKITATEGTIDSAVTSGSSNPVTGEAVRDYVDTQVTQAIAQVLATSY